MPCSWRRAIASRASWNTLGQGVIYRWDFEKAGEHRVIDVPGQLCVNEIEFGIEMALADRGITYCPEERIRPHVEAGRLQVVLADWASIEPSYYIYYPRQRQIPRAYGSSSTCCVSSRPPGRSCLCELGLRLLQVGGMVRHFDCATRVRSR
ncbi:LysR substrate-binding domain-containing protein [Pseudomonas sp. USTB-Z]|uniref:LysR substrate-binding domain-containing protein n=1 Tax=Pseudomonas sp. USTB-Z TaxID=2794351 RepID=UPI002180D346|nr:LysR substrate-binding domain-containing protein [Pseudomonas sp. USTB-Z]